MKPLPIPTPEPPLLVEVLMPPTPPSRATQKASPAATDPTASRAILLPALPERLDLDPVPAPPIAKDVPASPLRTLYRLAAERFAVTPGYIARFRRREMVDGKEHPEEVMVFKYRKDPSSIYMKWIGNEAKGRELLYVRGKYDDMIHVLPANSESGLFHPASRSVERHPDGPHGLGKERGPVADLGVGPWIERFGQLVDAVERGDANIGKVKYLGSLQRPECEVSVNAVMHLIPPGCENGLPKGGQRLWFFDTTLHFPVLLITHDAEGKEVEFYCLDRFLFPGPGRFSDEEFNPAHLTKR
jgi:hypothetical protein